MDKFQTLVALQHAGLPVPRTFVAERYDQAMAAFFSMGTVVVKPMFGSRGQGIVLVDDPDVAHRVFKGLELARSVFYVQEYLPHDNQDYRLLVAGQRVIAAMRRCGDNWKTNVACGARVEPITPESTLAELALKAAGVLGMDYAGIDILVREGRSYVVEANGIPGWSGLQQVTSFDIAASLAKFFREECRRAGRALNEVG